MTQSNGVIYTPPTTRESWTTVLDMPPEREFLGFEQTYTLEEFSDIQKGFMPGQMEDKWFIFFEEPWLFMQRSWTGSCIYALKFEAVMDGVAVVESWVNRNSNQYRETRGDLDLQQVKQLMSELLNYEPLPFESKAIRILHVGEAECQRKRLRTSRLFKMISGQLNIVTDEGTKTLSANEILTVNAGKTFEIRNESSQPAEFLQVVEGVMPDEE